MWISRYIAAPWHSFPKEEGKEIFRAKIRNKHEGKREEPLKTPLLSRPPLAMEGGECM